MNDKAFTYYTSLKFMIKSDDWLKVDDKKLNEIYDKADADVKANKRARAASTFENSSEYNIYLSALMSAAFEKKYGFKMGRKVNE